MSGDPVLDMMIRQVREVLPNVPIADVMADLGESFTPCVLYE